jgi:hypothetical protein
MKYGRLMDRRPTEISQELGCSIVLTCEKYGDVLDDVHSLCLDKLLQRLTYTSEHGTSQAITSKVFYSPYDQTIEGILIAVEYPPIQSYNICERSVLQWKIYKNQKGQDILRNRYAGLCGRDLRNELIASIHENRIKKLHE